MVVPYGTASRTFERSRKVSPAAHGRAQITRSSATSRTRANSGPFQREGEQEPKAHELELPAVDDRLGPGQELVRQEHAPVVREEHLVVELVESAEANPGPEVVGGAEGANGRIESGAAHGPAPTPERDPAGGQPPADRLGDGDTDVEGREGLIPVLEIPRQGDRGPLELAAALPHFRIAGEPELTEVPVVGRLPFPAHPCPLGAELERHRPPVIDVCHGTADLRARFLVAIRRPEDQPLHDRVPAQPADAAREVAGGGLFPRILVAAVAVAVRVCRRDATVALQEALLGDRPSKPAEDDRQRQENHQRCAYSPGAMTALVRGNARDPAWLTQRGSAHDPTSSSARSAA